MSDRRVLDLLQDMIELCEETLGYVDGVDVDEFVEDRALQRQVERTLELIGEIATRLGSDLPDIDAPWEDIKGLRVVLAHMYEKVRPERLHQTAAVEVADLLRRLEGFVSEPR